MNSCYCKFCGTPIEWLTLPRSGELVPIHPEERSVHFCWTEHPGILDLRVPFDKPAIGKRRTKSVLPSKEGQVDKEGEKDA